MASSFCDTPCEVPTGVPEAEEEFLVPMFGDIRNLDHSTIVNVFVLNDTNGLSLRVVDVITLNSAQRLALTIVIDITRIPQR
jgi:hypothetical protein